MASTVELTAPTSELPQIDEETWRAHHACFTKYEDNDVSVSALKVFLSVLVDGKVLR